MEKNKNLAVFYLSLSAASNICSVVFSPLLLVSPIISFKFFSFARKNRRYLKVARISFFLSLFSQVLGLIYLFVFVLPLLFTVNWFSKYSSDNLLFAIFGVSFLLGLVNSFLAYSIYKFDK